MGMRKLHHTGPVMFMCRLYHTEAMRPTLPWPGIKSALRQKWIEKLLKCNKTFICTTNNFHKNVNQITLKMDENNFWKPNIAKYVVFRCKNHLHSEHQWSTPIKLHWSIAALSTFLILVRCSIMTPSNGNFFRVPGHLCGEYTSHRWIPHTKASEVELRYFLWSAPE